MTKQANKDLELSFQLKDFSGVKNAIRDGADISYKQGWFFIVVCANGHLDTVKLFVEHPRFIKDALDIKKTYEPRFHEGILFSAANGFLDVVQYFINSPIYQQLGNTSLMACEALSECVNKPQCVNVLHYFFKELTIQRLPEYATIMAKLSDRDQQYLNNILFTCQLENDLSIQSSSFPLRQKI